MSSSSSRDNRKRHRRSSSSARGSSSPPSSTTEGVPPREQRARTPPAPYGRGKGKGKGRAAAPAGATRGAHTLRTKGSGRRPAPTPPRATPPAPAVAETGEVPAAEAAYPTPVTVYSAPPGLTGEDPLPPPPRPFVAQQSSSMDTQRVTPTGTPRSVQSGATKGRDPPRGPLDAQRRLFKTVRKDAAPFRPAAEERTPVAVSFQLPADALPRVLEEPVPVPARSEAEPLRGAVPESVAPPPSRPCPPRPRLPSPLPPSSSPSCA